MSRSVAMSIDLGVVIVMIAAAGSLTQLVTLLLPKWVWLTVAVPAVVAAVIAFVPLLYFFVPTALMGRTLGKELMGLRVVRTDGARLSVFRSLLRVYAYLLSLIPLGAGFAWVLVDGERRGWHDHVVGSRVVHVAETVRPTVVT